MQVAPVIISFHQLICSDVPDHDGTAAILTFGNGSFEIEVADRMLLSGHREPLFPDLKRWSSGHGPRFQRVVHLQAKVIVQMAGGMILNYKSTRAASPTARRWRPRRCRSPPQIAF